jgi:hypothetical protein
MLAEMLPEAVSKFDPTVSNFDVVRTTAPYLEVTIITSVDNPSIFPINTPGPVAILTMVLGARTDGVLQEVYDIFFNAVKERYSVAYIFQTRAYRAQPADEWQQFVVEGLTYCGRLTGKKET